MSRDAFDEFACTSNPFAMRFGIRLRRRTPPASSGERGHFVIDPVEMVADKPGQPGQAGHDLIEMIQIDRETGEFDVFDETYNDSGIYHGHQRKWEELAQEMQNALVKAGVVNRKGKPL